MLGLEKVISSWRAPPSASFPPASCGRISAHKSLQGLSITGLINLGFSI